MSVTTLPEAKEYLNLATTQHDTELQKFIDRAEALVTHRCGPLVSTQQIARLTGTTEGIVLPVYPVQSIDVVHEVGGSDLNVLRLTSFDGIIAYADGSPFPAGVFDVSWHAGHGYDVASVPPDLKMGVLELIRHLWDTQRGASRSRSDAGTPGSAYIFPYRVEQALAPFTLDDI